MALLPGNVLALLVRNILALLLWHVLALWLAVLGVPRAHLLLHGLARLPVPGAALLLLHTGAHWLAHRVALLGRHRCADGVTHTEALLLQLHGILGGTHRDGLCVALDLCAGGADALGHLGAGGGVHCAAHRLLALPALLTAKFYLSKNPSSRYPAPLLKMLPAPPCTRPTRPRHTPPQVSHCTAARPP